MSSWRILVLNHEEIFTLQRSEGKTFQIQRNAGAKLKRKETAWRVQEFTAV